MESLVVTETLMDSPVYFLPRTWYRDDIISKLFIMANCNMEHLERELICPLCNDYYTTPLSLPCHHNVCHRCAKAQISGSNGHMHGSTESLNLTAELSTTLSQNSTKSNGITRKLSFTSMPATPTSPLDAPRGGFNTAQRSSVRKSFRKRESVTGSGPITPRESVKTRKRPGTPGSETPRPESPICESPRPESPRSEFGGPPESPRGRKGSTGSLSSRSDSFTGFSGLRGRTSSTGKLNCPTVTSFHCPTCDQDVYLGDKGINGLFRNFALEVVVDRYKLAAKKAASIPCGSCKKKPPEDATKSCLDCKSSYCTECFAIYHPWGTPRAQHEYIGPTNNYRPKTLTCTDHHGEKVTMYCEGCHKPICHRCKYSGAHVEHKVSIIERKYAVMKEKMEQTLAAIRNRRQNITDEVQKLEQIYATIEGNSGAMQKELAKALELLQATLSEKHSAVTQRAAEEVARRMENIRKMLGTYRNVLQGCSAADLAAELLKETDKAMFVQAAKPLVGRLVETARSLKQTEQITEHYDSFGDFTLDSTNALKYLRTLDFLQVPGRPTIKPLARNTQLCLEWEQPNDGGVVESYTLEFMKHKQTEESLERPSSLAVGNNVSKPETKNEGEWESVANLTHSRYKPADLDMNSSYKFRVKACNRAGSSKASDCVMVKTPPAPVLPFKWTSCQPTPTQTSKIRKDGQEVLVSPCADMFATTSGSFPTSPIAIAPVHFIGDKKVTTGKHYWEVLVDQSPLAVHVGVASERMMERLCRNGNDVIADRDSGHDSCDELDEDVLLQDPTVFVTHSMGKLTLPPATTSPRKNGNKSIKTGPKSCSIHSNIIGVLLDTELGKVSFYDGETKDCLFTRKIKVSGVIQPAISIIGSGSVRVN